MIGTTGASSAGARVQPPLAGQPEEEPGVLVQASHALRAGPPAMRIEAKAAAADAGGMPTLKTKPGAVYFRYSINSLQPAM